MNAEDFLEDKYGLDGIICYDANAVNSTSIDIVSLLEEYHQAKLKLLGIANVVGQSERLKAFIRWNNKHNGIASPVPEKMADRYLESL